MKHLIALIILAVTANAFAADKAPDYLAFIHVQTNEKAVAAAKKKADAAYDKCLKVCTAQQIEMAALTERVAELEAQQ